MEKRVVQDIVPSNKRTIRNIPPKKKIVVEEEDGEEQVPIRRAPPAISLSRSQTHFPPPPPPPPPRRPVKTSPSGKRRLSSFFVTFLIIFLGIAVIAVALSLLYSKAAVTITPKTASIDISGTFTAKKAGDASLSAGSLAYELVTLEETMSQTVPATDGPMISTKAKGVATLYNEQTFQQKIVAGTRLRNSEDEIYRTTATVVIPAGKSSGPGSISVAILSDKAGAEYNMSLEGDTDFDIVAYQGTPKYETVYAKLKEAATGGFSGQKKNIAPEVQKAAVDSLKESLLTKLETAAMAKVPKDSVLFENAYTIDYEVMDAVAKDKDAEIKVKGTLSAAVFNKNALLKNVAAKELDKFPATSYDIEGMEDLKLTVVNSKDFSPRKGTHFIFTLKGPVTLVGTFSEEGLKNELKGTYLKDSNAIFTKYPSIANAYALITPFWMRSFPNSPDKIIIEIKK